MNQSEINILIEEVKSGRTESFEPIVEQHKKLVFSICLKVTGSPELAEEAAQDTFLKAFQNIKTFKKNAKFSTWLYRIAYTTSINKIRKKKLLKQDISLAKTVESDENCLDTLNADERNKYLKLAISQLGTKERSAIQLYYFDELSVQEISEILGMSVSNVKVKIHRTRKKLYTILSEILKEELNILIE